MSTHDPHDDDVSVPPDPDPITRYTGGQVSEGHLVLKDQHGERHVIDIDAAKAARDNERLSELTPDQVGRIEAFKLVLSEHDLTSLEDALANFRRDRTPEREIHVWERIARTYGDELQARPQADADERRLLYRVIFARSLAADMDRRVADDLRGELAAEPDACDRAIRELRIGAAS